MMLIDTIFSKAKEKMERRSSKQGNTSAPWEDFSTAHLINRLDDEFKEWKVSGDSDELLDIINLAAFVGMSRCVDESPDAPDWEFHINARRTRWLTGRIAKLEDAIEYALTQHWDVDDYKFEISQLKIERDNISPRKRFEVE